jgi:hypothetical protein
VSYFGKNWITASWPGAWVDGVKAALGDDVVPLVVNGCCGNINRTNPLGQSARIDDRSVGRWLTETARHVMSDLNWRDDAGVEFVSKKIDIAHSNFDEVIGHEAVHRAREILKREPKPRWANEKLTAVDIDWLFAAVILDVKRRLEGRTYSYEVQAFRIGDLALVGLIGEPFVEAQLKIKLESPAKRTFVAHMCNGYVAYIPTRHAYEADNYNFRTRDGRPVRRGANLFLLESKAFDKITDTTRHVLADLFREDYVVKASRLKSVARKQNSCP